MPSDRFAGQSLARTAAQMTQQRLVGMRTATQSQHSVAVVSMGVIDLSVPPVLFILRQDMMMKKSQETTVLFMSLALVAAGNRHRET